MLITALANFNKWLIIVPTHLTPTVFVVCRRTTTGCGRCPTHRRYQTRAHTHTETHTDTHAYRHTHTHTRTRVIYSTEVIDFVTLNGYIHIYSWTDHQLSS